LKTTLSLRESVLFRIAIGCCEEYIAWRLSAFMGKELILADLEKIFATLWIWQVTAPKLLFGNIECTPISRA
jgi:hypothetical protein